MKIIELESSKLLIKLVERCLEGVFHFQNFLFSFHLFYLFVLLVESLG